MNRRLWLIGILAVGIVSAQRGGGGGGDEGGAPGGAGGGMEAGGGMTGMGMRKASKAEQFVDKLKLNKEQRDEATNILSAARESSAQIRTDLNDRRIKLANGFMAAKSPEEMNALTAEYATVAAEMTKLEANTFAKIYALLKPNQQGKADQAFELLDGLMNASAGRPRGAGGMGGGGGRGGRGGR